MSVTKKTVDGVLSSYRNSAAKVLNILPDLIDNWFEHGNPDLMLRLLNGIQSDGGKAAEREARRVMEILRAMVGEESLKFSRNGSVFRATTRRNADGGRAVNGNAIGSLRGLIESSQGKCDFRSPKVDMALFGESEEKSKPAFKLDSRTIKLVKDAHKAGAADADILKAIRAAIKADAENAPAINATATAAPRDMSDVEDAVVIEHSPDGTEDVDAAKAA